MVLGPEGSSSWLPALHQASHTRRCCLVFLVDNLTSYQRVSFGAVCGSSMMQSHEPFQQSRRSEDMEIIIRGYMVSRNHGLCGSNTRQACLISVHMMTLEATRLASGPGSGVTSRTFSSTSFVPLGLWVATCDVSALVQL